MKCGLLLLVVVCTAASVAEDFIKSSPPAPAIAEFQFSTPQVGTEELANTMELKKTTKRRTTKPKPTATKPKPITTTTEKPTTTTTKKTTTTTKKTTTTTTEKPTTTTTEKPTTTTTEKPTTTTTEKPTTTTTEKPTTTTTEKPTTTTTSKPTTTTSEPNTTTSKPTTTTSKPNTTTAKPTTTTRKPTTTTVKPVPPTPTPPAPLIMGKYNITKNGSICQLAHMALQIRLVSDKVNGTFSVQPILTNTSSSSCQEKNTASLNITFKQGFIFFKYEKNTTGNSVYVKELSFNLLYPFGTAEVKYSQRNESLHLFAAQVGHSYSCRSESIYMGNGLYLDVTQDRMQAFNFTKSNEFGVSDPCPADVPTYKVAIAVGVILLVLVIIVVVAYVVGRRRRANGYQPL